MERTDESSRFFVETRWPEEAVAVVRAVGEIDLYTAPQLHEALACLDTERLRRLVVDLSECSFIDSTGLGVLVAARKRLRTDAPPAVVCQAKVREVFLITGLDRVFALCDTVEEALAVAIAAD
jgi:anti-sigma B factor antagonist